ncbi:MAG: hypothetical protein Q9209_006806 [Squamulea sp. 1 TL-2023]
MDGRNYMEGVVGRKLVFCPALQTFPTKDLIRSCEDCGRFLVYCCGCRVKYRNDGRNSDGKLCHQYQLVFTDGACTLNGQPGATAGIGLACGRDEAWQRTIPITADLDQGQRRTNQRAELWAALEGLHFMAEVYKSSASEGTKKVKERQVVASKDKEESWIIATDSEYVGIQNKKLRTSRNTKPENLDLFLRLDEALTIEEINTGIKIGFWHVPREYNTVADTLAKKAAQLGHLE